MLVRETGSCDNCAIYSTDIAVSSVSMKHPAGSSFKKGRGQGTNR